jgi:hypothetical protein
MLTYLVKMFGLNKPTALLYSTSTQWPLRARIFKRFWSPGLDPKE